MPNPIEYFVNTYKPQDKTITKIEDRECNNKYYDKWDTTASLKILKILRELDNCSHHHDTIMDNQDPRSCDRRIEGFKKLGNI